MNDLQPGHILIYDPHHCHHLTEIEKEIKILKPARLVGRGLELIPNPVGRRYINNIFSFENFNFQSIINNKNPSFVRLKVKCKML